MNSSILVVLAVLGVIQARQGFGPGEQDWGYVNVREGAHMFWWLYFTTADVQNYVERPLVIWLQGGPGSSSTGYGNFEELGPLDLDLNERNYTWVKDVNVLFVDNPVGTGFSYVDDINALTKSNREIAEDFLVFLRGFYSVHPEFVPVPLYIVTESYGGKMTPEIALLLNQAIEEGRISSNFLGIGLGDGWVDPGTTVLEYAPYLLAVGAVDQRQHDAIANVALKTKNLIDQGLYFFAFMHHTYAMNLIEGYTAGIDVYNILKKIPLTWGYKSNSDFPYPMVKSVDIRNTKLTLLMSQVQEALGLNVVWGAQSNSVYHALTSDIMKSVIPIVEEVLNTTKVKVAVYNGQLDLIVCTPGTVKWLDNLRWLKSSDWAAADRRPIAVDGIYEGFEKEVGNLALYWVNRAGHMVPADNPAAMDYILRKLTQDYDGTLQRQ